MGLNVIIGVGPVGGNASIDIIGVGVVFFQDGRIPNIHATTPYSQLSCRLPVSHPRDPP